MKSQIIIGHFLTLLLGGLVYISFRQDTLKMFSWFDRVNLSGVISELRLSTLPLTDHLPNWFLYSLPDGLWLFSYLSVLLVVWDNTISKQNIHWLLLVPAVAVFSEIGQLFGVVPGTFDIFDLTFYLGGTVLPILIFTNSKTIKSQTT
tara:strand:+ start:237 stop:680 length:444 start_codon:yes stop_codon:yes gene_type:complete